MQIFTYTLRVRWAEVDAQQVVFNGHYLTYFDIAINEYFRAIGISYPNNLLQFGVDWYVKKATIEYHNSALFDDWLDIQVHAPKIGNSSITLQLEIYKAETHIVSGALVYVNVDAQTKKSSPLPDALKAKLSAL